MKLRLAVIATALGFGYVLGKIVDELGTLGTLGRRVDYIDHRRGTDLRILDEELRVAAEELVKAGVFERVADDGLAPRYRAKVPAEGD